MIGNEPSSLQNRLRTAADRMIPLNHAIHDAGLDQFVGIVAEAHLREAADDIDRLTRENERLRALCLRGLRYTLRVAGSLSIAGQRYDDLIMQVSQKHPNETRHETARRYIQQAEDQPDQCEALEQKR